MGYQLIHHRNNSEQNGVGIVLDYHLKDKIISIERKSHKIIASKFALDILIKTVVHSFHVYVKT